MSNLKHIGPVVDSHEIRERINARFENLYKCQSDGKLVPFVCTFCDEILFHEKDVNYLKYDVLKKESRVLSWKTHLDKSDRIPQLEANFKFTDGIPVKFGDTTWLRGLALSPRGTFGRKKEDNRSPWGFSCCSTCKNGITNGQTPLFAIVNKNHVGHAPAVLEELTPIEMSLISPVKGYGYCFSYIGGANMNLKGTMTFMRVQESSIARGAAQLVGMGLQNTVVVLLSGKMTPEQKHKASRSIRVDKVVAAVEWLCQNHSDWKHICMDEFKRELDSHVPCVVDRSNTVESENSNVETKELFACYFPDEGMDEQKGGFADNEAFKTYVEDMQRKNYDLNLKVDFVSEYVKGNESDYLSRACLLQFPYGVGGLRETRIMSDESYSDKVDMESFLQHLTKLSQPAFQRPMFQLILYSLICKVRLLKKSRLQVRGEHTASALANDLNQADLQDAIRARQLGDRNGGTEATKTLLKAVDACSKVLPHSNEAAKAARSTGESLQHHFGTGSIWLTVTFDDENGLLMQILSDDCVDDDTCPSTMSAEELTEKAERRRDLRLNFPGFAAIHFEMLLYIVVEEVIGWDMRRNMSTGKIGLFGICVALAIAMEEQGRRSVHGHMTAIIEGVKKLQNEMFFGGFNEKKIASDILSKYHEHIVSTSLFNGSQSTLNTIFDHQCTVQKKKDRNLPVVVPEQCLRNFRHKLGYASCAGKFAYCKHCDVPWTYEELVEQYVRHGLGIPKDYVERMRRKKDEEHPGNIPRARLLAELMQYQRNVGFNGDDKTNMCVNAVYNHHYSFHTVGCFKCNKKEKKTHTCGPSCECRMRYPDKSRGKSTVKYHHQGKPWFKWDGSEVIQPLVEILPKRATYDLFQNTSCRAISESKLCCNTNAAVITDGPIGQYQFKYQHKQTQKDDTAEYQLVEASMKKLCDRKHDDDKKEAVRLVCRAAFAHNAKNVVGAPLASYLIRHGSRFYFSHQFEYCPLRDLRRLLCNQKVKSVVKFGQRGDVFFENMALHYLCRPDVLEELSPKTFFENYYTVPATNSVNKRKRGGQNLRYKAKTKYFQHYSAKTDKSGKVGPATMSAKKRKERAYVKISQWEFPDTGSFDAEVLNCTEEQMSMPMEKYCEVVLTLLMPYRGWDDFMPKSGGTKYPAVYRLREIHEQDRMLGIIGEEPIVFTEENQIFLQNIQDAGYNSMRYKISSDDLQSRTHPYERTECFTVVSDSDSDSENPETETGLLYESFLEQLVEKSTQDQDSSVLPTELQNFTFKTIRNNGKGKSGYIEGLPIPTVPQNLGFQNGVRSVELVLWNRGLHTQSTVFESMHRQELQYGLKAVMELLLSRSVPKMRSEVFKYNPGVQVMDANGSVRSILQWSDAAKLDHLQRKAFEIIICSFLYTFFETVKGELDINNHTRNLHRKHKQTLKRLTGTNKGQIIALMLGPGGSGKSTVINLVVAYAREYCEHLGHPYTNRTIVVTAMSGIAATLIHGETTHKALGLNRDKIPATMIDEWWDTRVVIVDEISFASGNDIDRIQKCCGILKRKSFTKYGNLNIVFCGDFSQLEPVGRLPIYKERGCVAFHQYLNTFIELNGHHRFKDDPTWGEIMYRFREGVPTIEDVRMINSMCMISPTHHPPPQTQIATYYNKDRDAINCAIFEQFTESHKLERNETLQHAVIVFMDNLEMENSKHTFARINSNAMKKWFYSNCGEDSCKMNEHQSGRVDPVLKLYTDCPLMLTQNKDVPSGQANGSRLFLKTIHVKTGESPFQLKLLNGCVVRAFFASQINSIEVRHEAADIVPNIFHVQKEHFTFKCRVDFDYEKSEAKMRGHQFPLISNNATTGHKLQGYTASSLLVADWVYTGNWTYTVLSRVRTMNGLYLVKPLSEVLTKYEMAHEVDDMLQTFRNSLPIEEFDADEYETFMQYTDTNTSRLL